MGSCSIMRFLEQSVVPFSILVMKNVWESNGRAKPLNTAALALLLIVCEAHDNR